MAVVCRVTGLLLFVSASAWGAEWDCESKTYLFCTGGTCSRITETAALAVDTDEGMTLRTTSKGGRDFMRIISVDVRKNATYVHYSDAFSHGFTALTDHDFGSWYEDTMFTANGSWVSSGSCSKR